VRVLAGVFVRAFSTAIVADLKSWRRCRANGTTSSWRIQGIGIPCSTLPRRRSTSLACGGQKWLLSPGARGFVYVRKGGCRAQAGITSWMAFEGTDDFSEAHGINPNSAPTPAVRDDHANRTRNFVGDDESLQLLRKSGPRGWRKYAHRERRS